MAPHPIDSLALPRSKKSKSSTSGSLSKPDSFPSVSQSSIFDLRGLVAEHQDKFQKEGKRAVKGEARLGGRDMSRDKFNRPSPGIIKRLAHESKITLNNQRLGGPSSGFDPESREAEENRAAIMKVKAEKYEALRRGDYGALTDKELKECTVDFERKWQDGDAWSDHDSDEDESAKVPEALRLQDDGDEYEQIEYIDELGRTRKGTRKEAREAETARRRGEGSSRVMNVGGEMGTTGMNGKEMNGSGDGGDIIGPAHAEVLQSNVIYGAQSFFPVYEPTQEELRERIKAAQGPAETNHYDATKDVRDRAAGAYQFSQDETIRAAQMEALKKQREETEAARRDASERTELTAAQESKKRKLDERRALIEAKRQKLLGGKEGVEKKKAEMQDKAASRLLEDVEREMGANAGE